MRQPFSFADLFAELASYVLQQAVARWMDETLTSLSLPILTIAAVLIALWGVSLTERTLPPPTHLDEASQSPRRTH